MAAQVDYTGPAGGGKINVGYPGDWLVTSTGPLRIVSGTIALDGSNPTPVTTGLGQIVAGGASLSSSTAPGTSTIYVSAQFASVGGTMNLYAWKATATGDCTYVASTGTETVNWWAMGT